MERREKWGCEVKMFGGMCVFLLISSYVVCMWVFV